MSIADVLGRLRAVISGQRGRNSECTVLLADLEELLVDFDCIAERLWAYEDAVGPPAGASGMAALDVLAERHRQICGEGFTSAHDDAHLAGNLAVAASCYAMRAAGGEAVAALEVVPVSWPWGVAWWKPSTPRRDLVRAGALILAEIERIDRAGAAQ